MFGGIGKTFVHTFGRMMHRLQPYILTPPVRGRVFTSSLFIASSIVSFSEERRNRISRVFSLAQASQSECFDAVFAACKERRWKHIENIREDCDHLVNAKGRSILLEAFEQGEIELAEELIKRNIALHLTDRDGNGVAHYAVKNGYACLLPWEKLDINACNNQKQTPLHIAAEKGDEQAICDLIANGAAIDARARFTLGDTVFEGVTPLHIAIICNHHSSIDILLNNFIKRADPTIELPQVGNLLHIAIHFRKRHALRHLLTTHFEQTQPLVSKQNLEGRTPTMEAAFQGDGESLVFLKEKGASLDDRDPQGRTALHWATLGRQHIAINLLYYYRCDLRAEDVDNNRPLDLLRGFRDSASLSIFNHLKNLSSQRERLQHVPSLYAIYPPENLVFKGGGPKGIAYVGAMRALEQEDALRDLLRVAGTSAGAINATFVACGYNSEELEAVLRETELTSFLDHPLKTKRIKEVLNNITLSQAIEEIYNIYKTAKDNASVTKAFKKLWGTTGLCEGEVFRQWIEGYIQRKTRIEHCTFGELASLINQGKPFKHLHIFTTRVDNGQSQHINSEDPQWKDVIISDAVRASMSIPGIFNPHVLHKKKGGKRSPAKDLGDHIDGGLIRNFPIETFDKRKYLPYNPREGGEFHIINKHTLGLRLCSPKENQSSNRDVETIGGLLSGILSIYLNAEELLQEQTFDNEFRTISIDNRGVGATEFHLTETQKTALIASGELYVKRFYTPQRKLSAKEQSSMVITHIARLAKYETNIEVLPEDFIERNVYLEELSRRFFQKDSPLIQILLWGYQGHGKSSIAVDFANRNIEKFSFTWKIDCEKESDKWQSYHDLAEALGISSKEDEPLERLQRKVHLFLESQKREKPYLLIFDNAEKVPILPKRGGCILMTSREKIIWRGSYPIKVESFTPKEAEHLLVNTLEEGDRKAFAVLAKELGYHPSTIAQTANYIATTPGMTTKVFLEILKTETKKALKLARPDDQYPVSTIASWKIIQDSLKKSHPEALDWLQCCAFLSPDAIPIHWVDIWLQKKNNQSSLINRGEILRVLTEKSLVHYDQQKQTISFHRLRQHLCQMLIGDDKKEVIIDKTLQLLFDVGENINHRKYSSLAAVIHLSPHAEAIFSQNLKPSLKVASLASSLGMGMFDLGMYEKAKNYHEKAYQIRIKILKSDLQVAVPKVALDITQDVSQIGACLSTLGEYEEANIRHHQALKLRKMVLGDEHELVASSLHSIAVNILRSTNQDEDAEKYMDAIHLLEAALTIAVNALGTENPFVGVILNTSGCLFLKVGIIYRLANTIDKGKEMYDQAQRNLVESLRIFRKTLGNKHHRLIEILTNIGRCSIETEQYEEAMAYLEEAYEIYERHKTALEKHPSIPNIFYHTALCYSKLGKNQEALKYGKLAFIAACASFEEHQRHDLIALSLEGVVSDLKKLNDDKINEETKQELLPLCRKHLGEDHEGTCSLANMKTRGFFDFFRSRL